MASTNAGFILFTRLPLELRLKIWEHTVQPRIVEVFIKGHLLQSEDSDSVKYSSGNNLTADPPFTFQPEPPSTREDDENTQAMMGLASGSSTDKNTTFQTESIIAPSSAVDNPLDADDGMTSPPEAEKNTESGEESDEEFEPSQLIYVTSSAVPPILHICRESRNFALQIYTLRFGTILSPPRIYFNDSLDTLFLPYWCFDQGSSTFAKAVARHEPFTVQHIAFEIDKWYSQWRDDYINYQIEPLRFQDLKDITFLESQPHPDGQCSCCFDPERPAQLGNIGFAAPEESSIWPENVGRACQERFKQMKKDYPNFSPPVVKVMALTRNGVRI